MGINPYSRKFLQYCKESGIDFQSTLQIGRLNCFFSSEKLGIKPWDFAEPFFRSLGAEKVESLDYSDYQQASIIHDMNQPISENLKERFSVVLDGGTLEHVFNYPVAIKSCMDMVKIGGNLILTTPANNFFGHGFYQFSPELFFSLLSEENGFSETQIFEQDDSLQWFKIQNPKDIKCRVDICIAKNNPSNIYVVSKKIKSTPKELKVLQSDYVDLWEKGDSPGNGTANKDGIIKSSLRKTYQIIIPSGIRRLIWEIRRKIRESRYTNAKKKLFYRKVKLLQQPKRRKYE